VITAVSYLIGDAPAYVLDVPGQAEALIECRVRRARTEVVSQVLWRVRQRSPRLI
jgi:hypothetical protein